MTITVFTPTYNRGDTIINLYKSLLKQTCQDFEWVIVNDGSTDDTISVLENISKHSPFPVSFYTVKNGGKHRAINLGVKIAKGRLFFIVDSDDTLTEDAIETIIYYYNQIKDDKQYAGVVGLKQSQKGVAPFCNQLTIFNGTAIDRRRLGPIGENAEVVITELLKQFPFPEFPEENFISEAVVWTKIASAGYKFRWFNKPIYNFEYQSDGLTLNLRNLYKRNPKGYLYFVEQENRLLHRSWLQRMSQFGLCIKTVKDSNISKAQVRNLLNINWIEYIICPIIHSIKCNLYSYKSKLHG